MLIGQEGLELTSQLNHSHRSGRVVYTRCLHAITFNALANKTFGDADFNVSATASSGCIAVNLSIRTYADRDPIDDPVATARGTDSVASGSVRSVPRAVVTG